MLGGGDGSDSGLYLLASFDIRTVRNYELCYVSVSYGRSQWPRGLRCRSAVARQLRLWVRTPLGAWMFVCCECCVLSRRGLCDDPITRPGESYRL